MPTGGLRSKRKEIQIKKCHRGHPTSRLNTALRIILPINTSDHVPQSLSESKARPEDVLSGPTRLPQNSSDLTAMCPHWNSSGLRAVTQAVSSAWNILLPFFHRAKSLPSLQPAFNSHKTHPDYPIANSNFTPHTPVPPIHLTLLIPPFHLLVYTSRVYCGPSSHLPPAPLGCKGRHLYVFYFLTCPEHPKQCLVRHRHLVNICFVFFNRSSLEYNCFTILC